MKKRHVAAVAAGAIALGAIGTTTILAQDGETGTEEAPSGEPVTAEESPTGDGDRLVEQFATSATYDDTVLTKFVAGGSFDTLQSAGVDADLSDPSGSSCFAPDSTSGGSLTSMYAGVELPDGARIKQLRFYGEDNDANNITITLFRSEYTVPVVIGSPSRAADVSVTSFSTAGESGDVAVSSTNNLEEVTGNFRPSVAIGSKHRFHTIRVTMSNTAASSHVLCGVEVLYQVLAAKGETGTVFHPIDPVRAYDSRRAFPTNGPMAPNSSRVISVKDGYTDTTVTTADAVPDGATAVTYNITVTGLTGPNFASVTPGNATGFTASAINWDGSTAIANAGTTKIDANRRIKVWAGDQSGSFDVIIDITGYYIAPVDGHPMMGG